MCRTLGSPVLKGGRSTLVSALIALSFLLCPTSSSSLEIDFTAEVTTDTQPNRWSMDRPITPPRIHDVSVGSFGEYRFKPRFVNAQIGDMVRFSFTEGNHTVTESTFMSPCSARGPFNTNFFHNSHQVRGSNEMTVVIDTTNPRWFFCRQIIPTPHCLLGMVFAINPGSHWFEFVARARNQSTTTSWPTSGRPRIAPSSGRSTASDASSFLGDPWSSSTSTVVQESTRTSTIATVTPTVNPHLTWSTVTITSMITTTFSVPQ